ncbi:MAG: hypothetical protein EB078_08265 [Proteobacteria bacterium]|nr:hypothetical protein [Pseudomonadota bacterium]NDD04885.1 hypothetical protein [Pseudomonadota bacterium]
MNQAQFVSKVSGLLTVVAFLFPVFGETATETQEFLKVGKIKSVVLKEGQFVEAVIPAKVVKGHHIQANPATLPNLIATEITLDNLQGIQAQKPVYPKSKPWKLVSAGKTIETYDGDIEFKVGLSAQGLKPGKYQIKGSVRYQACNDKNCFFPTSAALTIPVTVVK